MRRQVVVDGAEEIKLYDRSAQVMENRADPERVIAAQTDRLTIKLVPGTSPSLPRGHWGGVTPAADGKGWTAARTPFAGGTVAGY